MKYVETNDSEVLKESVFYLFFWAK